MSIVNLVTPDGSIHMQYVFKLFHHLENCRKTYTTCILILELLVIMFNDAVFLEYNEFLVEAPLLSKATIQQ